MYDLMGKAIGDVEQTTLEPVEGCDERRVFHWRRRIVELYYRSSDSLFGRDSNLRKILSISNTKQHQVSHWNAFYNTETFDLTCSLILVVVRFYARENSCDWNSQVTPLALSLEKWNGKCCRMGYACTGTWKFLQGTHFQKLVPDGHVNQILNVKPWHTF